MKMYIDYDEVEVFNNIAFYTANRLRRAREDIGMTPVHFAEIMGMDVNSIYAYENGRRGRKRSNLNLILKWALITKKRLDYFFPTIEEYKCDKKYHTFFKKYYENIL